MQTTIDTIRDTIFKLKENVKDLNERRDDLIRRLSLNYNEKEQLKIKIETLDREVKILQSESLGMSESKMSHKEIINELSQRPSKDSDYLHKPSY